MSRRLVDENKRLFARESVLTKGEGFDIRVRVEVDVQRRLGNADADLGAPVGNVGSGSRAGLEVENIAGVVG